MAGIVVIGGGMGGLSTALLLAGDGHEVTVLERDPAPPPAAADAAWDDWDRKGVNQFRMIHYFLPRFREIVEAELPDVVKALDADGVLRFNPIMSAPDFVTGGYRAGRRTLRGPDRSPTHGRRRLRPRGRRHPRRSPFAAARPSRRC